MDIRKVTVGLDYINSGMHYIVGQVVFDGYRINSIIRCSERSSIQIWIEKNEEIFLWKEFSSQVPMHIEYNINI